MEAPRGASVYTRTRQAIHSAKDQATGVGLPKQMLSGLAGSRNPIGWCVARFQSPAPDLHDAMRAPTPISSSPELRRRRGRLLSATELFVLRPMPTRKLLQPLRDRAGRPRRGPSRNDHRRALASRRWCRAWSAKSAAAARWHCATLRSCAASPITPQDHPARPVHDVPAGQERVLRRPDQRSLWPTRRRSTRSCTSVVRSPAPTLSSSTNRGCGSDPAGSREARRRCDQSGASGPRG